MNLRNVSAALLMAVTLSSCGTSGQNAVMGAATGAAIGGLLHGRGSDALAGAAIGAGAGYVIGKVVQDERERAYASQYGGSVGHYPLARLSSRPGFVRSPYSPHRLIDVRGIPRGAKVVDPSTDRIFINP